MKEINNYMTTAEASYIYDVKPEALKAKLKTTRNADQINDFIEKGLIKQFKKPNGQRSEWIISKEAMSLWFPKKENKKL